MEKELKINSDEHEQPSSSSKRRAFSQENSSQKLFPQAKRPSLKAQNFNINFFPSTSEKNHIVTFSQKKVNLKTSNKNNIINNNKEFDVIDECCENYSSSSESVNINISNVMYKPNYSFNSVNKSLTNLVHSIKFSNNGDLYSQQRLSNFNLIPRNPSIMSVCPSYNYHIPSYQQNSKDPFDQNKNCFSPETKSKGQELIINKPMRKDELIFNKFEMENTHGKASNGLKNIIANHVLENINKCKKTINSNSPSINESNSIKLHNNHHIESPNGKIISPYKRKKNVFNSIKLINVNKNYNNNSKNTIKFDSIDKHSTGRNNFNSVNPPVKTKFFEETEKSIGLSTGNNKEIISNIQEIKLGMSPKVESKVLSENANTLKVSKDKMINKDYNEQPGEKPSLTVPTTKVLNIQEKKNCSCICLIQ